MLWETSLLDAEEGKYVEEVSTSNVFVVKDGKVYTPGVVGGGSEEDTASSKAGLAGGLIALAIVAVAVVAVYITRKKKADGGGLADSEERHNQIAAGVMRVVGAVLDQAGLTLILSHVLAESARAVVRIE